MNPVFHIRPIKYIFLKNWWGFRKGAMWTYKMNGRAYLLDMGCLTIGIIDRARDISKEELSRE